MLVRWAVLARANQVARRYVDIFEVLEGTHPNVRGGVLSA